VSPELVALIHRCWARAAVDRPSFDSISSETANLLERLTDVPDITPRPPFLPELAEAYDETEWGNEQSPVAHSPSLEPTEPLEGASECPVYVITLNAGADSFTSGPFDDEVVNPEPNEPSPVSSESDRSFLSIASITGSNDGHFAERQPLPSVPSPASPPPDQPLPTTRVQRDTASARPQSPRLDRSMLTTRRRPSLDDGYESPVPMDEAATERRNESRYHNYLVHPYHPSLSLPRMLLYIRSIHSADVFWFLR
jgi:hypothetical protein